MILRVSPSDKKRIRVKMEEFGILGERLGEFIRT